MSYAKRGGLLGMLSRLTPMRIIKFGSGSDGEHEGPEDREPAEYFKGANVASSRRADFYPPKDPNKAMHSVLLDLDVPAYLIESSTPGHSHLYVDIACRQEDYFAFLDAAAKIGLIEAGYAEASKAKGGTYLRLPWVKKGEDEVSEPVPAPLPKPVRWDEF